MQTFASSTVSLPVSAEKKQKRGLLRRLSLGKSKTPSSSMDGSGNRSNLASRSTATLAPVLNEKSASRGAIDLFSSSASAYASMPSTPKTPITRARSTSECRSRATSTRTTSAATEASRASTWTIRDSRIKETNVPAVPQIPKTYLISDEVFVIANPPQAVRAPRMGQSNNSFESCSMPLSFSSRSHLSWISDLGRTSPVEAPAFPAEVDRVASGHSRSSLDEIDEQLLVNLCEVSSITKGEEKQKHASGEDVHSSPKLIRRSSRRAAQTVPPVPVVPARYARQHARCGSAPVSLGPLPPQPSDPPSEAVLRHTNHIKRRYSKPISPLLPSSPLLSSGLLESAGGGTFISPRLAPTTPKSDMVSGLLSLEADLSLESKLVRRSHRRSGSTSSVSPSLESGFPLPKQVKLTPGHMATRCKGSNHELGHLVSRFSEDSDPGCDESRGLLSLFSPVLGSRSKQSSASNASSVSDVMDLCRRNSALSGSKTPEMVPTSMSSISSSSSSSCSSYTDLSDFVSISVEQTLFDLARPSVDYRAVYASAQEYAKSSNSLAVAKLPNLAKATKHRVQDKKSTNILLRWNKSQRHLVDPVDRSYHLRKH